MTTVGAYSVYDKTAESYATPFFAINSVVAKRNFRFSLTKLDDIFVKDLELFCVGYFDQGNGMLVGTPVSLVDTGENVLSEREIEKKNSEVKQ